MPARHAPRFLFAATLAFAGAARAEWTGEPLIDRMTDFEGWVASTVGEDFDAPEAEPTLWVRCRNGKTDISVFGIHPLAVVNFDGATPVMTRFGDGPSEQLTWVISSDGYGAFATDPIAFARRLAATEAERLLIRLTPTNRLPYDMAFSLEGARVQVEAVAARCGWPIDPPPRPQEPAVATMDPQQLHLPAQRPRPAEDASDAAAEPRKAIPETTQRALSAILRRHFSPMPGSGDAAVTIEIEVDADGSLTTPPKVVNPAGQLDRMHETLRRAAIRAVYQAHEYGNFASVASVAGSQRLRITFTGDGILGAP